MNSQPDTKQTFYIHTLGCKVNQYESQAMRELLTRAGFEESGSKESADICIVNTCTVTAEADRESKYVMQAFHRANPAGRIIATGCLTEKDAGDIAALPNVAHVIKNADKGRIVHILTQLPTAGSRFPAMLKISDFKDHSKAFVKIQDGCENHCSYCKVPLVRSYLISKPVDDIVREVACLAANGFREIVLTGICLGAWGRDLFPDEIVAKAGLKGASIVDVLKSIVRIPGDFRIRLSSIEPKYVTDELIDFMAGNPRMCRHLHIPLQSGDDDILKKMNRPYTAGQYRTLVDKVRSKIQDVAITTDVLVGFPGESQKEFMHTLSFIKAVAPARTHVFTFSKREGTPAFLMAETADQNTVKRRYDDLHAAAAESAYYFRRSFLKTRLDILVETKRDRITGCLKGYSDNYIKVHFEGPDDSMKTIAPVTVTEVSLTRTAGVYAR